jgi:hypothetical protein
MGREVIEGTVETVNERGVRLNGQWYNVSKFRAVELPRPGARVQLGVDTKGFILEVTPLDNDGKAASSAGWYDRDLRLQVLELAAKFGASRPDLKSADVLKIAEVWVEWIERE